MKKRKPSKIQTISKIVAVQWEDAWSTSSWRDADVREDTLLPVLSVGFLHDENKDRVILRQTIDAGGMVCGLLAIPRSNIKQIKVVGEVTRSEWV